MRKTLRILPLIVVMSACVHAVTKLSGTGGLTGLAALDNNPNLTVSSLVVTPSNETHIVGETIGYTATATLSNGSKYNVTGVSVWSSNNQSIAPFLSLIVAPTPTATFKCNGTGSAQITASFGSLSASAGLTCNQTPPPPTITSIAIGPATPSIAVGQTQTFAATATYSDGTTADVTGTTTWVSGTIAVATQTTLSIFKCVTGGSSTITGTVTGVTPATATLTCNAQLVSIAIAPATASVLIGAQPTFIATGTYSDGSKQNLTLTSSWTSSNNTIAKPVTPVTSPETVNALAAGTATITAAVGSVSGTASLTVTSSGPPPPTLTSGQIAPATIVVNVGSSVDMTDTGTYSDGSTQNITSQATWTTSNAAVAALQLADAVPGVAYSTTLSATCAVTPCQWSVPSGPAGTNVDMLDYAMMPLPTRNTNHISGSAVKYFHLDAGLVWWLKGSGGNPWDGVAYDSQFLYDWFTENGDGGAQDTACQTANNYPGTGPYSSCFTDPYAYKMFVQPISAMPRYYNVGGPDVVLNHPSPNNFVRTTNCGQDNQPQINLGNVVEVTHTGDYLASTATRAFGGSVGTQTPVERLHFWGLSSVTPPYQSGHLEIFDLVLGYGQVEWRSYHWNGSAWALDQDSLNNNSVAGGSPTPNFGCKLPQMPLNGTLPPGQPSAAHPQLNLTDTTGAISGTPNAPGSYTFTAQSEDAAGTKSLQTQTIRVPIDAAHALQTVNCLTAGGPVTITATVGSVVATRTVTCQSPTPTLSSIVIKPTSPTVPNGSSTFLTATGTYSDGSTQDLSATATWTSSNTSIVTIAGSGAPRAALCNASGTSNIVAQVGAVSSPADVVTCTTPVTGQGGNIYCTTSGTWVGPTTDGPAAMPTQCMMTALSNTPSPGTVHSGITTCSGLQTAVNAGTAGDIYQITTGSDLGTCSITLPAKAGSNSTHWNTIETSGVSNPSFPAEGVRMTPCYSNVQTMPNRTYSCASPLNLTFRVATGVSSNSFKVASGAAFWRIIGAHIDRVPTPGAAIFQLVDLSTSGTQANNIIFDRSWFSGIEGTFPSTSQATDTSTTRGIYLGQSNHVAVIDSYFTNFYDTSVRSANGNTDAQCMAGGFGSIANSGWGTYKFVNNHCEASGEGILLGGAGGPPLTPSGCTILVNCNVDTPADLEIRQNYFFKPPQWDGNTTTVATTGWPVVKNGWEMKTGVRALFEANVVESCWYNAQGCATFNVAPVNQQSGGSPSVGTCPTCGVTDFIYRYNYSYNVAAGIAVYAFMGAGCSSCQSQGMNRVSIHDNVIGDNLNLGNLTATSAGDATELLAVNDSTNRGLNKMQNVNISHNTFVKAVRSFTVFGGPVGNTQMVNIVVQNNILPYGNFGFVNVGNPGDCESTAGGSLYVALNNCVTNWTWDHNALFNQPGALGRNWPTNGSGLGNFFYPSTTGVGFTAYGTGNSNFNPLNYQLNTNSPGHNAGSDGKDLGADVVTLNQKIQGVRQ